MAAPDRSNITGKADFRKLIEDIASSVEQDQNTRITNKALLSLLKPGRGRRREAIDYGQIDPARVKQAVEPILREAVVRKEERFEQHKNGNYVRDVDITAAKRRSECHYLWSC